MEPKHLIPVVSALFTVVLLLMGYLWNASDKRMDALESRHMILVEKMVDLSEKLSRLDGFMRRD